MSGDVDDKDVVKIGSLSGANVVIAGSVIKSGNSNRLSLKALDVKTGQIITMARESY
jgi:TolB-like protein